MYQSQISMDIKHRTVDSIHKVDNSHNNKTRHIFHGIFTLKSPLFCSIFFSTSSISRSVKFPMFEPKKSDKYG